MNDREMDNYGKYIKGLRDRLSKVEADERNARGQLALLYKKRLLVLQVTVEHGQIDVLIREREEALQNILNDRYDIEDQLDEASDIRENAEEISKQIARDVANLAANLAAGGVLGGIDIAGAESDDE